MLLSLPWDRVSDFSGPAGLRGFPTAVDKQRALPSLGYQRGRCSRAESARGAEPKVKISLNVDCWWEGRGSTPWAGHTKQEKEGGAHPRNRIMSTIAYGLCLMTQNDCALLGKPGQYESIIQHSKDDDDHHHLHLCLAVFTKMKQNILFSHVSDMW